MTPTSQQDPIVRQEGAAVGPRRAVAMSPAKRLALDGLLVALSVVGSLIKIPSALGTPAFDSLPGYFGAAALGVSDGALVAAVGHLATAATAGFPLTVPIHLLVAAMMAVAAAVFGWTARRWPVLAALLAVLVNGVVAPAVFILIPQFGLAFFIGAVPALTVASALNVGGALLLYLGHRRRPLF